VDARDRGTGWVGDVARADRRSPGRYGCSLTPLLAVIRPKLHRPDRGLARWHEALLCIAAVELCAWQKSCPQLLPGPAVTKHRHLHLAADPLFAGPALLAAAARLMLAGRGDRAHLQPSRCVATGQAWGQVVIVDLFAGAAGWDEAARHLQLGPVAGIELDPVAGGTRTAAGHATIRADVAAYPTGPFAGQVTGLIASPPASRSASPPVTGRAEATRLTVAACARASPAAPAPATST
jgi:hypothetical protein